MQMEFLVVKASANILCTNCQNWGSRQPLIPFCMKLRSTQAPCIGFPRQYSCATRVVQACSMEPRKSTDISNRTTDLWHTAGATLVGVLLEGSMLEDAYAAESISNETVNVASRAPQWLAPAVIAFPVFSYALFNIYRDKVNPRAKVSDWMFGLAAMVIVANLVTIVTLGVRLY